MSAGQELDDTLDTTSDTGAAVAEEGQQEGETGNEGGEGQTDLQDRMSEGLEDDAWYSESTGAVVDGEGNAFINPKTKQPFKSMAEYEAAKKESAPAAKPKPEAAAPAQAPPTAKSFEQHITDSGKLDAKTLFEMEKAEAGYKYADELVPAIDPKAAVLSGQDKKISPVQNVEAARKTHEDLLLGPLNEIKDGLIKSGYSADEVETFMKPYISKQMGLIDTEYRRALAAALKEEAQNDVKPILTQNEETKLKANSESNVAKLATAYFPKGGKDAFMALVNGHNATDAQGKPTFVRGPAAPVFDLLVKLMNKGKSFASQEALTSAYRTAFLELTADPAVARSFFDIAHTYFKGKNLTVVYNQGKVKGAEQQTNIRKFIKPKPQSQQPATEDDDKDMPSMLRTVLNSRGHFAQ
jgi:hypothetical protein